MAAARPIPVIAFDLILIAHCFPLIAILNERPSPKTPKRMLKVVIVLARLPIIEKNIILFSKYQMGGTYGA